MLDLGWVAIHRKMKQWEWYSDVPCRLIMLELILTVNWEDKKWQGQIIKRGQIVTSNPSLAEATGLSEMQVRTVLKKLESTSDINRQITNKYQVITLCNYSIYQDIKQSEYHSDNRQITGNQQADNRQITATKQYNNLTKEQEGNPSSLKDSSKTKTKEDNLNIVRIDKKIEAYPDYFEEFWKQYPRKDCSKAKAYQAWKKQVPAGKEPEIMEKLLIYKGLCLRKNTEPQYIKHATTFINNWKDTDYQGESHAAVRYQPTQKLTKREKVMESIRNLDWSEESSMDSARENQPDTENRGWRSQRF